MPRRPRLQDRWYAPQRPPWWTRPLSALFGTFAALRRVLYRRGVLKSVGLPVPVIVVGNITAGVAGKTPLTISLFGALRARGFKPGVVSRGYGGLAIAPRLLCAGDDPRIVGDEPLLIAQRTGAPVAVGRERPAAAKWLIGAGVDVIVADDGLQHYALQRDLEICVIDGMRRFGNGCLLPAGPLREPVSRLHEADFVVCNGGMAMAGEIPMRLVADEAVALRDQSQRKPLSSFAGQRVHAIAGIGDPARFFALLRGFGIDAIEHAFRDHHAYAASDLDFHGNLPLLMTEKDAVKCRGFAQEIWWAVPVHAQLPDAFIDSLIDRLPGEH